MTVLAAGLALLGSLFFALGAALQQFEAASTAQRHPRHLIRRPRWLLGGLAIAAGTRPAHRRAEPTAPSRWSSRWAWPACCSRCRCAAALHGRRPRPGELAAAAVIAIGLIGLVLVVPEHGGRPPPQHRRGGDPARGGGHRRRCCCGWPPGRPHRPRGPGCWPWRRACCTARPPRSPASLVDGDWEPWFLLAVPMPALIALALLQRAYAVGHFGVSFAALQVADPLTAVAFGALLLGEPLPTGAPSMLTALAAAALTAAGTVALATYHPDVPSHRTTADQPDERSTAWPCQPPPPTAHRPRPARHPAAPDPDRHRHLPAGRERRRLLHPPAGHRPGRARATTCTWSAPRTRARPGPTWSTA